MPPSDVCGQALQSWLLHGDDRCVDSLMNVPREVKFRVVRLALQSIESEESPNAGRQNPVAPGTEHLQSAGPATSATAITLNEAMVPSKRRKSLGSSSNKEQDTPPQTTEKDANEPLQEVKKRKSFEGAKKNYALEGAEKKESFELPCVTEMLADTCVKPKVMLYHARLKLPSIQRELSKNSSAESYSTFLQKLNLLEHAERLRPSQLPSLTESEVAESLTAIVESAKKQELPHVFCKALVKRQAKIDVDDFVDNLFRATWPCNVNASDTDTESETFDPFSPRACLIPDCNLESFCADVLGGDVLGALLKKEDAARILTIAQSIPALPADDCSSLKQACAAVQALAACFQPSPVMAEQIQAWQDSKNIFMLQIKKTRTEFWARVQDAFWKSAPQEVLAQPLLCQLVADFNNDKAEAWALAEKRLPEWCRDLRATCLVQLRNAMVSALQRELQLVVLDMKQSPKAAAEKAGY